MDSRRPPTTHHRPLPHNSVAAAGPVWVRVEPAGQHPTVDAWAEAVRDDWAKFMHKVGGCSSHVAYSQPTFDE